MTATVEHLLDAHPQVAAAWYPTLARVAGRVLSVPALRHARPLARRVDAVAKPSGRVSVRSQPRRARPSAPAALTVLSANLWHDWPRQKRWSERLEAVALLVEAEGADVVLLQEVTRTATLATDQWLADRLGLAVVYARANGDVDAIGFEEGPAILSRFPMEDVHLRQLGRTRNPLARRVALGAHLCTPQGRLLAVSAHLGLLRNHNERQIRALREWVARVSEGEVAVIGGDFNAPEDRPEITQTAEVWTDTYRVVNPTAVSEATTHAISVPGGGWLRRRRLDYVFVQQPSGERWQVLAAGHLDAPGGPHSDHRAVLARLSRG